MAENATPGWNLSTKGAEATAGLARAFGGRGWMAPQLPQSLATDLVMAESGNAWTTDPTAASPYAAASLWEGDQPPSRLLVSLYGRRTPYVFIGRATNGYDTSTMLIARFGQSCVVLQPGGADSVIKATLLLGRVLQEQSAEAPAGELRYWLWERGGSVALARRADADDGVTLFEEFGDSKWEMLLDGEAYFGPGPTSTSYEVSDAWDCALETVSASEDRELQYLLEVAGTVASHRPYVAPKTPAPVASSEPSPEPSGDQAGSGGTIERAVGVDPLSNEQLAQMAAWRCFAEVHRRHPDDIEIIHGWQSNGATIWGAHRADKTHRAWLKSNGALDSWAVTSRGETFTRKDDAWGVIFTKGLLPAVRMLEGALGLTPSESPAPATAASLATRVIATLLARSTYSAKTWRVISAHEGARDEPLFRAALAAGLCGDNPRTPTGGGIALWRVDDHWGAAAVISADGRALSKHLESPLDLLDCYRETGRDIQAVVTRIFGVV